MAQPVKNRPSYAQPIIVGLVLALLVGSASPWWWEKLFDSEPTAAIVESADPEEAPVEEPSPGNEDDGGEEQPEPPISGCQISIENPLVTLYEDTDRFGLDAGRVSPGDYAVEEIKTVTFGGKPERWFRITDDGTTGWIEDSSILIASKSGACQ